MICPWFGPFPDWMPLYLENVERLRPHGYDWLIDTDLDGFRARCRSRLNVEFPGVAGEAKAHDYRPALGVLYQDELAAYDYWGHTDFDCVYGRVWAWLPDALLSTLDVYANHHDYISGPWTLYRNWPAVNALFSACADWRERLEEEAVTGWAERDFTAAVDAADRKGIIRRLYAFWQTNQIGEASGARWDGDLLMDGENEIFMAHFNRTKEYPRGCLI